MSERIDNDYIKFRGNFNGKTSVVCLQEECKYYSGSFNKFRLSYETKQGNVENLTIPGKNGKYSGSVKIVYCTNPYSPDIVSNNVVCQQTNLYSGTCNRFIPKK
jgi:hypothetical protein